MKLFYKILFLAFFLCITGRSYANLPGFSYYKVLIIQSSMVAGTGNHTDFPVLISHTDPDLRSVSNGGHVDDINGFDIAFSDATGNTPLKFQLEGYDPSTGKISFWVKIPNLSTSSNTVIRIYYGNPNITTDQSSTDTWDANFKAVYHLNNDLNDGTSTSSNLANVNTTTTPGKIENGRNFITGTYLYSAPNSTLQITGNLTLSAWVKINSLQTGLHENCLISHSAPGEMPIANTLYYFNILNTGQLNIYWENGGGFDNNITTTNTINTTALGSQYSLLSVTRNSSTKELFFYQNGVLIEGPISYSNNPNVGINSYLRLGKSQEISFDDLLGNLDEVRISNNVRSKDWLKTSYNTMNDPANFYSIGPEVLLCNPPIITTCLNNITVTANSSCQYTMPDSTGAITASDNCGFGLTTTQVPAPGTNLTPGVYPVYIIVEDVIGQKDTCEFELTIESSVNPTIVSCGDVFTNETTQGHGNNGNNYSCSPTNKPGEDIFYQITVPTGNYQIIVTLTNASDANENRIFTYWLGSNCPSSGTCSQEYKYKINTNKFLINNSNQLVFSATGPATYYFVVDSKTDHIDSYDISFNCITSGIEFDESNCGNDINGDGIYAEINGTNNLTVQPCQNVTVSHTLYIKNENNAEWLDSVNLQLGSCYTNINNATLTPDLPTQNTGFYNTNGEWSAVYDNATNSIDWTFTHSGIGAITEWGDGVASQYNCYDYTFSFDATISSTCTQDSNLNIFINVSDDGVATTGATVPGFDYAVSSDFDIDVPNVGWHFTDTSFCKADNNPTPLVDVSGGTFSSAPPGLSIDTSSGQIYLNASNLGTYNITYSNGLCPHDSTLQIVINPEDDPSFSFPDTLYCQGGNIFAIPTITGTPNGSFSNTTSLDFDTTNTGDIVIDIDNSPFGIHYVTYTTPGPNCPNNSVFTITIEPEQIADFTYPSQNYCKGGGSYPIASILETNGGYFTNNTGIVFVNPTTGEINVDSSATGIHTIKYYTPGPNCIDSSTFNLTIYPEENAGFNYLTDTICKGDNNPIANITGTNGGTFTEATNTIAINSATGEIDLSQTAAGTYTITYTTPNQYCPKDSSINITILDEQIADFTYPNNSFCQRDDNPVPNLSQNSTPGGTFSNSTGVISIDSLTGEIDLLNSQPGTYAITYTTPGPYCINLNTTNITIYPEDTAQISYPLSVYCTTSNNTTPSITGNGQVGTFQNNSGINFVNTSTGEIDISNSPTGQHIIFYTTQNANCPFTTSDTIFIQNLDNPSFSFNDTAFCTIDNNPIPTIYGTQGGTFYSNTGLVFVDSLTGEIDLSQSNLGYQNVTYVTPDTLCNDSLTISILILEPQIADAGDDQELVFSFETTLDGNEPLTGIGTWIGNENYNFEDINDPFTQVSNLHLGTNVLVWKIDDQVCPVSTDSVLIRIKDLIIPQIITPNNDGKNDYLFIENIDLFENSVEIYNRWGQLVYKTDNYENNWTGTDEQGNQLINDTYFYIIKIGDDKLYKGFIVIKR